MVNSFKNTVAKFLDANTLVEYSYSQMLFDFSEFDYLDKRLVFLYCSNKLNDVGAYLSLLNFNFAIVLLNEDMPALFKSDIERLYLPYLIIDGTRVEIDQYATASLDSGFGQITIFYDDAAKNIEINRNTNLLLSTSGTTGSPKLVKLSYDNLYQNACSIVDYLPICSADVVPLNLPLYYSYGLSVLNSNLLAGGIIVCGMPNIISPSFWTLFRNYEMTSLAGVPFLYELLEKIGFLEQKYNSLKYLTQAGGKLHENLKKIFLDYSENAGILFYVMYGQTEATARISYVDPSVLSTKLNSIGKPINNGVLEIDSLTNELLYKGPNVFGGYCEKKADLRIWENVDYLRTGDLASKDEDGFFYLSGRLKRICKMNGHRINLDELEASLRSFIKDGSLACIGSDDKKIILFTSVINADSKNIYNYMNMINVHFSKFSIIFFEEMPMTPNNKIDYNQLIVWANLNDKLD